MHLVSGSTFVMKSQVSATSLYEDPAAGLREDASAGVREHPAPRLLDLTLVLAVVVCGRLAGSHWRPRGQCGHHRERPDSRDTVLRGQLPDDADRKIGDLRGP